MQKKQFITAHFAIVSRLSAPSRANPSTAVRLRESILAPQCASASHSSMNNLSISLCTMRSWPLKNTYRARLNTAHFASHWAFHSASRCKTYKCSSANFLLAFARFSASVSSVKSGQLVSFSQLMQSQSIFLQDRQLKLYK